MEIKEPLYCLHCLRNDFSLVQAEQWRCSVCGNECSTYLRSLITFNGAITFLSALQNECERAIKDSREEIKYNKEEAKKIKQALQSMEYSKTKESSVTLGE